MTILRSLVVLLLTLSISNIALANRDPSIKDFISTMSTKHKFNANKLTKLFDNIQPDQKVIQLISKPAEGLPWHKYKNIFINQRKVTNGVKFWRDNAAILAAAEKKFGVPAEIIVSIIGVESDYGRILGSFQVLRTLATLAFHYPPRAKFFRAELEKFLVLARDEKIDPTKVQGSYAGAMGAGQFMPSSYQHYAVNFSTSGDRNIISNMDNTIGSVANYFKSHGWQQGQTIVHQANTSGTDYQKLGKKLSKSKPSLTLSELAKYGVSPKVKTLALPPKLKLSLLELENKDGKVHWLGTKNFYVITRYNHSNNYAMVVYELSQKLRSNYLPNRS